MNDFLETLEGTPVSPSFQDAANRFPFDMVAALAQDTDAIRKARRDAVDDFVANVRAEIAAGEFYLDTCRGVPGHPPESLSDYIDGQRALLTDLDALSN
ncbi:MAG: hypothetical protein J4F50_05835 [Acidimicrobiia bacterium]|nr:hypothetical protein [Acidimicrobiia bacterium]